MCSMKRTLSRYKNALENSEVVVGKPKLEVWIWNLFLALYENIDMFMIDHVMIIDNRFLLLPYHCIAGPFVFFIYRELECFLLLNCVGIGMDYIDHGHLLVPIS